MVFQLENEQVWMQSVPRLLRIREGDQVTIEERPVEATTTATEASEAPTTEADSARSSAAAG